MDPHRPKSEFQPKKSAAAELRQQEPGGIVKHLEWSGLFAKLSGLRQCSTFRGPIPC